MGRKPKRRSYGSGSVYPNTDSTLTAAIRLGNGKFKRSRHADRASAEAWLVEQNSQKAAGIDLANGSQSLQAFTTTWYNDVALPRNIKAKTAENYRKRIEYYILPYAWPRRLSDIRPEDVQRWVNWLRAMDLASSTVCDVYNLLKQIFDVALRWQYIPRNPAALIDRPKREQGELEPFTIAELHALLDTAETHRLRAAFLTAPILGPRLGELLGLRWVDLSWERAEIKITQQVQNIDIVEQTPDGPKNRSKVVIETPKTKAGRRTIPVPPLLLAHYRAHWDRQQGERTYLDVRWKEHGLIFPSEVGTPMSPRNFERLYHLVRQSAGIRNERNFHLLRHTCASLMGEAGVIEEVRAAILGHSRHGMTQHYTHATPQAKRRAVEAVERMLLIDTQEQQRSTS